MLKVTSSMAQLVGAMTSGTHKLPLAERVKTVIQGKLLHGTLFRIEVSKIAKARTQYPIPENSQI